MSRVRMLLALAAVAGAFGAASPAQAQQFCHDYVVYTGCTNVNGICVTGYGRVGGGAYHSYRTPCPT